MPGTALLLLERAPAGHRLAQARLGGLALLVRAPSFLAVRDGLAKATTTTPLPLGERELQLSDRAANYLSVGQIDLLDDAAIR